MTKTNTPYRYGSPARDVILTDSTAIPVSDSTGSQIDPATEQTLAALADALDSQSVDEMRVDLTQQSGPAVTTSATVATWNAGTLPTEQQTPVGVEDSTGTQVDPATETTLTELSHALASTGSTNQDSLLVDSNSTLATEQQTPVGVEDSTGTQIDPATETTLTELSHALASTGSTNQDSLLVDSNTALDVSAATVPVEQQTPVGVEDSTGTQVDPATEATASSVANAVGNQSSLTTFSHSTAGTTAEALAANAVPDGTEVVVQAKRGNSGLVYVGNSTAQHISLDAAESVNLDVTDTSLIYVQTPTSGDGVNVIFEG